MGLRESENISSKLPKHLAIAAIIAGLAFIRICGKAFVNILTFLALTLGVLSFLQNVAGLETPVLGQYLSKISVEASLTLIGILIAVLSAERVWRNQKRDELALASLNEIELCYEESLRLIGEVHGYVLLLRDLQVELKRGPYSLDSFWMAKSLKSSAIDKDEKLRRFRAFGVNVHTLDARNIHVLSSNVMIYRSFKSAKSGLLQLVDISWFTIPTVGDSVDDLIAYLRYLPDNEYLEFTSKFDSLNQSISSGVGGLRGAIQAKYFPPTMTFARALLRADKEP